MKTAYTIYRVGHASGEYHEIDWPEEPGYDKIKALIEPLLDDNPLEHVTVLYDGERADMFVDEMGAMKPLPVNERATVIYRTNWLTQHPKADPDSLPAIHGTAILFHRRVWY